MHTESAPNTTPRVGGDQELGFVELLLVLTAKKKQVVLIVTAAAVLAAMGSALLPNTYTSTTTILPPQQTRSAVGLLLTNFPDMSNFVGQDVGDPTDVAVAILQSRTIADHLIDRFDLRRVYGAKQYQQAGKMLESRSAIEAEKEGLISISVSDRDAHRAAGIANAYVDELKSFNIGMAAGEAEARRAFYQQKLDSEREALAQAELALQRVKERTGFIQPESQLAQIVKSTAEMRAQIAVDEVKLQTMRTFATASNPDLKFVAVELAGLRDQLLKLQKNTGEVGNGNLEIPTTKLPGAQLEYLERFRDVAYHEALRDFLGNQVEAALLDEDRNASVVEVVDKAVAPERRSDPQFTRIVVLTAVVAFLLSCLGIFALEALRCKEQHPKDRVRLALLHKYLRSWSPEP